jgi:hypothetical protein
MPKSETAQIVEHAKANLAAYSDQLRHQQDAWRQREASKDLRKLFPSTEPGGRQAVSPLGGEAEWPWGGRKP